jgi:hypothetical protein
MHFYTVTPVKVKVKVGTHLGPVTNFSPSFFNHFYTVTDLLMWAPSLTRRRVCILQFLLSIASPAFLMSESPGTHEHISLSLFFETPQPEGPGYCIYFPQEQGSPVTPPGIGFVIPVSTKFGIMAEDFLADISDIRKREWDVVRAIISPLLLSN